MRSRYKTRWQIRFYLHRATRQIKYLAAVPAVKMMVMRLARHFIAGRIARQIYRRQPAFFHQRLDVPVYRRNAKSLDLAPGMLQYFLRSQGTIYCDKNIANRRLLPRVALQHRL